MKLNLSIEILKRMAQIIIILFRRRFGKINRCKAEAQVSRRNWSVLYVSYLQAIRRWRFRRLRPLYKRFVVYRCRVAWEGRGERSEDR